MAAVIIGVLVYEMRMKTALTTGAEGGWEKEELSGREGASTEFQLTERVLGALLCMCHLPEQDIEDRGMDKAAPCPPGSQGQMGQLNER